MGKWIKCRDRGVTITDKVHMKNNYSKWNQLRHKKNSKLDSYGFITCVILTVKILFLRYGDLYWKSFDDTHWCTCVLCSGLLPSHSVCLCVDPLSSGNWRAPHLLLSKPIKVKLKICHQTALPAPKHSDCSLLPMFLHCASLWPQAIETLYLVLFPYHIPFIPSSTWFHLNSALFHKRTSKLNRA